MNPSKSHAPFRLLAAGSLLCILLLASPRPGSAQAKTQIPPRIPGAPKVFVQHIRIYGKSLAGNLEGEQVDRPAIVFLPPSYFKDKTRRYPVVYALHGFFINAEKWTHEIHVPQTIEGAYAKGARQMIVVLPDSHTIYGGSMYSGSETTGDFERYVYHDVVHYMDTHYRTIPNRRARGLVGHSMGGYGALRIGMQHPEVFGSLYIMSACCLSPMMGGRRPPMAPSGKRPPSLQKLLQGVTSPAEAAKKLPWFVKMQLALAAAWSPDPGNPPLFLDLPMQNGKPVPAVEAEWAANSPLAMIGQYIYNLRRYRAIGLDVGDEDGLRFDMIKVHKILDRYGIKNTFQIYHGTHTSHVAYRFQNHVLPFFGRHLCFAAPCRARR